MTRRLLLHIGTMKTGTTYLQHAMNDQRARLSELGWVYPPYGGKEMSFNQQWGIYDAFPTLIPWVTETEPRKGGAGEQMLARSRTTDDDLIISSEAIASVDDAGAAQILEAFGRDDVRVVLTARDLGRVVLSAWQQGVKSGASRSLAGYVNLIDEGYGDDRAAFWREYDVAAIVRRWSALVGHDNVTVVTVPKRGADHAELWRRFVRAAELPPEFGDEDPQRHDEAANISLRTPELALLLALNRWNGNALQNTQEGMHLRAWMVQRWRDQRGTDAETSGEPLRIPGGRAGAIKRWSREQVAACQQLECRLEGDWSDLLVPEDVATGPQRQCEPTDEVDAAALRVAADAVIGLWRRTPPAPPPRAVQEIKKVTPPSLRERVLGVRRRMRSR